MEYASKGKGNAALTTGIIGTVGAGLLLAGRGGLGGLLGNPGVQTVANEVQGIYHDTVEYKMATMYADLQECKSERYTDAIGLELYKTIMENQNRADEKRAAETSNLYNCIIELNKEVALNKQAVHYENIITRGEIGCVNRNLTTQIENNKVLNGLADANIITYVDSKFVPGALYLPAASITPAVELED